MIASNSFQNRSVTGISNGPRRGRRQPTARTPPAVYALRFTSSLTITPEP